MKYGILFLGNSSHSERVFRIQKKCMRIIAKVPFGTSCRPLFKQFCILPLPCVYILEVLMLVKNNLYKLQLNNYNHEYYTRRGHNLRTPQHNLTTVENNPLYIGVLLYNKLSEKIKNSQSFKKSVVNYLSQHCFYSLKEYFEDRT